LGAGKPKSLPGTATAAAEVDLSIGRNPHNDPGLPPVLELLISGGNHRRSDLPVAVGSRISVIAHACPGIIQPG
jgi:hypothetical protein